MKAIQVSEFLALIRKRLGLIVLVTVISSLTSAYITMFHITPIYSNSCTLLVNEQSNSTDSALRFDDILLYEKLLGTYKDILKSNRILKPVTQWYGHGLTPEELASLTQITTNVNSQVITISVRFHDYKAATDLTNYIALTFKDNLQDIMSVDNVQILDEAELRDNPSPVSPNFILNMAASVFLGLSTSVAFIWLSYVMDSRIKSEDDLKDLLSYPLLGSVPSYPKSTRNQTMHR
ncbi:hypothetical protein SY83_02675 [Paenibacillus swuensis]|uniref:Polysaccharide chain length determinant N-terminal domain-containing protein n=1 Tax=Paenibacillus swuensis TaxID=1178515 RepID=A0A172TEU3_9BACL|nr:Wzz/FepE/Etk N-terminal domain-containing protein [Paenibacillus swuensis]ANE45407.1 hypothetical protein SY83_02675 [Paenibacillus swuensis]